MLLNFENNFNMYNNDILDNISLENLSPDIDMEEEENVYIHIKELEFNDSMVINIPFSCKSPKTLYCQPIILGEPMKVYPFLSCNGTPFDYIKLNTYDSIQTDMEIIGETDLLQPNVDCNILTGVAESQCPNECFNTKLDQTQPWISEDNVPNGGITYRIRNIDSSNCNQAKTIIRNDANLIPFAFVYYNGNTPTPVLIDNNYQPNQLSKV